MSDVGGEFRYTTRHSDLATAPDWKAGDQWSQHYVQAGLNDRDSELELYLASGVTTRRLVLVDKSGRIVANFGVNSVGANNLNFLHNDSLTSDSFLHWSKVGELAAGVEELRLSGPKTTGVTGGGPQISFVGGPAGAQLIELDTGDAAGALSAGMQLLGTGGIAVFSSVTDIFNIAGSAHAPIQASAFTVVSTERAKIDIKEMDDARLLEVVRSVRAHTFRNKVRPQSPRLNEDAPRRRASADHDCSVDLCQGTADHPCTVTLNDTKRIGLIAEHVYKVAPEITELDAEHKPSALGVDQVAATAFGAVGALLRKVEALEKRIDELTGVGR